MHCRKFFLSHLPILLLACLLVVFLFFSRNAADAPIPSFHIQLSNETGTHQISLWKSTDGIFYLFLPSNCTLSEAVLRLDTTAAVRIDGKPIRDGQDLAEFELGRSYTLSVRGSAFPLQILRSANVSTLYLETASGSMKAIHADKSNSEKVTVTLITSAGKLDYAGDNCTIRGRGNSTWVYEKRPYLLSFTEAADLLGMGAANKWVLLANATDESNLRNKLIYDLTAQTGLRWTPECEYVDLYLNGEYAGLYLLAERVEIGENRLNIADDPESFLCKLDLNERLTTLKNPLLTEYGRAVEITAPENIPSTHTNVIAARVQQLENAILGRQIEDVLDLDSWCIRLLIDEITENLDGDRASSYFHYTNGKFYAGPIWDYDHVWGSRDTNLNPEALLAESHLKAPEKATPYNNALYENPVFYARMVELYEATLLPLFQQLTKGGIEALGSEISHASTMNSLRWRHMFDHWNWRRMTAADLTDFLTRRLAFLNKVWLEDEKYYSVQVEISEDLNYLNFAVLEGETFDQLADVVVPGVSNPIWVDSITGEVFSKDQPITRDIHLNLVHRTSTANQMKDFLIALNYFILLLILLAVSIWFDIQKRRPKRRCSP